MVYILCANLEWMWSNRIFEFSNLISQQETNKTNICSWSWKSFTFPTFLHELRSHLRKTMCFNHHLFVSSGEVIILPPSCWWTQIGEPFGMVEPLVTSLRKYYWYLLHQTGWPCKKQASIQKISKGAISSQGYDQLTALPVSTNYLLGRFHAFPSFFFKERHPCKEGDPPNFGTLETIQGFLFFVARLCFRFSKFHDLKVALTCHQRKTKGWIVVEINIRVYIL